MPKPLWDDDDPNLDGGRVVSPVPGVRPGFAFGAKPNPPNRYKNPQNRHTGTDWPGREGAPVVMVGTVGDAPGVVTHVTYDADYGNSVRVRWEGHTWRFCHLSRVDVNVGQQVRPNEQLGLVGSTGHVFGPHLHLEQSRTATWAYNDVLDPTKGW